VPNFVQAAGLPPVNTAAYFGEGVLTNTAGVTARAALPIGANAGGLDELVVPYAEYQVQWVRVGRFLMP
jgi:hypothetical protein